METQQGFTGQDDKKWDRVWTTEEIRKNSANWTLAGDVGLYNFLNEFAQNIISRTHEVQNSVDTLLHKTKMASVKINNVINDFHMLSNVQFVENRVYDEEIQDSTPETKPVEKTKEQREAEMLPKIMKALELGMAVLDQSFNKIHVNEISDSEDEDLSSEGRTVFEPKDPYAHRPLPFIIGSEEFMKDDHAGLKELINEEAESSVEVESSSTDSDETSSSEEDLPMDDDRYSGIPTPRKEAQSISERYSSSEESELFGNEEEKDSFISDSSADAKVKDSEIIPNSKEESKVEVRDTRQSSVSSMQSRLNLPQVLPTPKRSSKKKESEDLFATDDASDEEDSPFRKKTGGLFSTEIRFDDEKDMFEDDLFGSKSKEIPKPQPTEKSKPPPVKDIPKAAPKSKEPDLFGDDEDSEDDIFSKLTKVKSKPLTKENIVSKQESPDMADSSSTPSSAPSVKPSGNAFDFVTGSGTSDPLFGDDSDGDDLFSIKKTSTKKFDFAADDDDGDDLFGLTSEKKSKEAELPKKKPKSNIENDKPSLFEEGKSFKKLGMPLPGLVNTKPKEPVLTSSEDSNQQSHQKIGMPLPGLATKKHEESIFEDSDSSDQQSHKKIGMPLPGLVTKKHKDSIFEDSDSSDQGDKGTNIFPVSTATKPEKNISIFDDDDEEDDIFSQKPKLFSPGKSPSVKTKSENILPVESPKIESKKDIFAEKKSSESNLFGAEKDVLIAPSMKKKEDTSLFEESDSFDLFKPKTSGKPKQPEVTVPAPVIQTKDEDSLFSISDTTDGPSASKIQEKPLPIKMDQGAEDVFFQFDTPADSSKTLNVVNKDRAKITTKRRKPTRKGRLTTAASGADDPAPDSVTSVPHSSVSDSADDLFSSEEPETPAAQKTTVTHKTQEKKKMDLMSQLMSEAASSKIGKKPVAKVEEEEDVVDIFAELGSKRDKSKSFTFKSPIESTKSSVLEDSQIDDKEVKSFLDPDDADNDDFFAEPSFRKFSHSISKKESILDMDDDDDDDLFKIKPTSPISQKENASENDIFADDSDIFAEMTKEKYEMFPSQLYDNDDDDIFGSIEQSSSKVEEPTSKAAPAKKEAEKKVVKEVEKKPAFEDPLTGLLGED